MAKSNGPQDSTDTDALEKMVKNVELFLNGALTQLQQLKRALRDPKIIETRRVQIKAKFMEKINDALEELQRLEDEKSPDVD